MFALSVCQPWASLLVLGHKRFETRGWHTGHRGPLAIHASKLLPPAARQLCLCDPVRRLLAESGFRCWTRLPRGVVLGTVELLRCLRVEELLPGLLAGDEPPLGDFRPGQWAWEVASPRPLAEPLPARGRLGLFQVPLDPPE